MKFNVYFILVLCISVLVSCGDDVDCTDTDGITTTLTNQTTLLNNAVSNFNVDQSEDNCNALEDAAEDFVDALRDLQDCADDAGQGDLFRESIADAESIFDDLECGG